MLMDGIETGFGPRCAPGAGIHRDGQLQLALQELWLGGTVTPAGARLAVRHVFQSAERDPLEVVYAFALPRDAALRAFTITGEGFEVRSELQPVVQARKNYERGLEEGQLASLAQVYRDGLVNLTVGNIRPGELVRVCLELLAGVELHDDGLRFRFPFTLAPCYHAGARTSQAPDGGQLELPEEEFGDVLLPAWRRDAGGLHRVGFALEAWHPAGIAALASLSHPVRMTLAGEDRARVELATAADVPNRDLVLDLTPKTVAPCLLAGRDEDGNGRAIVVVPSTVFGEPAAAVRRVLFLVDRSGSMAGAPLAQAKQAVRACLGALAETDSFGIVAFDDKTRVFENGMAPATAAARAGAERFLAGVDASGGTELEQGLRAAAKVLGRTPGEVVLLTDGQVFAGEAIVAFVAEHGLRVHCLGIGSASQDRFLAQLARASGGASRFLTPRERVDLAVLELFNGIGAPVAARLQAELSRPESALAPAPAVDVYAGTPAVIPLVAPGGGEERLRLRWETPAGPQAWETPVDFAGLDGSLLKLFQGARLIADLEARADCAPEGAGAGRQAKRLDARLQALSREYGLASRAMSLVAVVPRPGDISGQLPVTHVVPVGLPEDLDFDAYFAPCSLADAPASPAFLSMNVINEPLSRYVDVADACETAAFAAPRFLRAPRSVPPSAAVSDAVSDFLVEQAGKLLPDGGLPGASPEERLLRSALLLLAFAAFEDECGAAVFTAHRRRLEAFLAGSLAGTLPADRRALLQQALSRAAAGRAPAEALPAARRLLAGLRDTDAWQELAHLL